MAISYGFYNSIGHDRKYSAIDFASIFDGIINDGVFMNIGSHFSIVPTTGMTIAVGSGRAWFNSTWTLNDADYLIDIDSAEVVQSRIDAVVLEVDKRVASRKNSIKVLKGTPSANPEKPTLTNDSTTEIYQYALGYITLSPGLTSISASNITQNVGMSDCPFITGILQTANLDSLYANWNQQFLDWFYYIQTQLEGDVAYNLQNQINQLKIEMEEKASEEDVNQKIQAVNTNVTSASKTVLDTNGNDLINVKSEIIKSSLSGFVLTPSPNYAYINNAIVDHNGYIMLFGSEFYSPKQSTVIYRVLSGNVNKITIHEWNQSSFNNIYSLMGTNYNYYPVCSDNANYYFTFYSNSASFANSTSLFYISGMDYSSPNSDFVWGNTFFIVGISYIAAIRLNNSNTIYIRSTNSSYPSNLNNLSNNSITAPTTVYPANIIGVYQNAVVFLYIANSTIHTFSIGIHNMALNTYSNVLSNRSYASFKLLFYDDQYSYVMLKTSNANIGYIYKIPMASPSSATFICQITTNGEEFEYVGSTSTTKHIFIVIQHSQSYIPVALYKLDTTSNTMIRSTVHVIDPDFINPTQTYYSELQNTNFRVSHCRQITEYKNNIIPFANYFIDESCNLIVRNVVGSMSGYNGYGGIGSLLLPNPLAMKSNNFGPTSNFSFANGNKIKPSNNHSYIQVYYNDSIYFTSTSDLHILLEKG